MTTSLAAPVDKQSLADASQRSAGRDARDTLRLTELTALTEAGLAIVRAQLDVDALCELVYEHVSRIVDPGSFHLGLFEGDRFSLKVWVQDGVRLPPTSFSGAQDSGIVGWMRATQQPLLVRDFELEMDRLPARPSYVAEHPPRSAVFVPLVARDQVVGSMSAQSARPEAFNEDDLPLLGIIANQAASAIVNARLFEMAQRRAGQLATIADVGRAITAVLDLDELLTKVVELIQQRFGYYHVQVFLVEDDTYRAVFKASTGHRLNRFWREQGRSQRFDEGIIGWVASSGQHLLAKDVSQEPRYIADDPRLLPDTRSELAVPLKVEEQVLGVLDVQSRDLDAFGPDDLFVLNALANQVAVAVEVARAYQAQEEEAWMTMVLLQVTEATSRADNLDGVLSTVARLVPVLTGVASCGIWLWDEDLDTFSLAAAYGLRMPWQEAKTALRLRGSADSAPALASMKHSLRPVEAPVGDAALPAVMWLALAGDSAILVPLLVQNKQVGSLIVGVHNRDTSGRTRQKRLTMLSGIASQAAAAIENLRLQAQEEERARFAYELQVAKRIQESFLPARTPQVPGYQLAHAWQAAREVGGDFYDFVRLSDGRWGLLMGDVADKGVPAALFMATSLTLLRVAASSLSTPLRALNRANELICTNNSTHMFATVWYGVLDPVQHTVVYANAGHSLALHVQAGDGAIRRLRTVGLPLGVVDPPGLGQETCTLAPGDLIVLYTDGLTDLLDEDGEEFGQDRLESLLFGQRSRPAVEIVRAILDTARRHAGVAALFDDITLMVIKRQG